MTDPEETRIVTAMSVELQHKSAPMEIAFAPLTVFQLTGLVQLACRHPAISPELRLAVRAYFADCPAVLDVVRRGDDPAEDMFP